MKVNIRDAHALRAVTPAALAAYAQAAGWSVQERYREHSVIYVGDGLPEIIIPRTERLGDYASIVAAMIDTFAQVADQDELTVYRSLVTADRDVVRVRVGESDDGSVTLDDGAALIRGTREMVVSVARSMHDPRPAYYGRTDREVADLLKRMRLGQTDQGSFVVTLLTPVVPRQVPMRFPDPDDLNAPIERRMTRRLVEALRAVREMVERTVADEEGACDESVASGVSANLCEALVRIIQPFPTLDVGVSWARTRSTAGPDALVRFGHANAALLKEVARSLRERAPRPDVRLPGFVRLLQRDQADVDGTIVLAANVDGRQQSVLAVLDREDYERAVQAHQDKVPVVLAGDLDRVGKRWRLLNPRLENIISDREPE